MKKILSCFLSAIILTGVVALTIFLSGCSDEEKAVAGDGKILYAWTGSYTAEQHNNAILEYFDSCEAIEWTNEKGLHIKTDFKATNARMRVFIPQVLSDISTQVHSEYYTAPIISKGLLISDGTLKPMKKFKRIPYGHILLLLQTRQENFIITISE